MKDHFDLQPVLRGSLVELRPLRADDFEELYACAADPEIWRQHPQPNRYEREVFRQFFDGALGSGGGFVIQDLAGGKIIGSARYYDLDLSARSVFIGYTFLTRAYWGGKYNREVKALMIRHALKCLDFVLFEIGANNLRSRTAMERIGAKLWQEALLDDKPHVIYKMDRERFRENFAI